MAKITDIILKPKPYNVDIEISYDEDYTYQDPQDGQVTVCKSEYLNTPLKTATESFEYPYTFVEFEGQKYIEDDALYIQKRVYPMNDFFLDPENYVKPDLGIFKVSNVIWREILN